MNANDSSLYLRSERTMEVLDDKPSFVEKWALAIFFGILLLVVVCTWFIHYPDIIETRAVLTADNAPKEIIVREDGRLVKLMAQNDQKVKKEEIIGWIESTADHNQMLSLSRSIDSGVVLLDKGKPLMVADLYNDKYTNLGEAQEAYRTFISAFQQFKDYMVNGFYSGKLKMLHNDIKAIDSTNKTIQSQKALSIQDLKLSEESYKMNKRLYDENVISREELRTENSHYLSKQILLPQLDASLLMNENQKRDKQREIQQLSHDSAQEIIVFQQALQSLKSTLDEWKRNYVLQSPIDGTVVFMIPVQENQYLLAGKLLGYINPVGSIYYAEANLPQENFGKVTTGMKVQLRFDAYPYQEMGFVEGSISYVSNVASDSGILATIRLDRGLITNNHHNIIYENGLKAQAIVITRDLRLLQRLWYNFNEATSIGNKRQNSGN